MADTKLNVFTIGQGKLIPADHTGPASYTTGGETLGNSNLMTGVSILGLGSLDAVHACNFSISGNYEVKTKPVGAGERKTFKLLWLYASSGVGGAGVQSVTITAAGTYTGTTPSVTFAAAPAGGTTATGVALLNGGGTAVIAVVITNPGSGYLVAPAVTFGAGGATGTAVLNPSGAVGTEVASATNLSGETVRLSYIGR